MSCQKKRSRSQLFYSLCSQMPHFHIKFVVYNLMVFVLIFPLTARLIQLPTFAILLVMHKFPRFHCTAVQLLAVINSKTFLILELWCCASHSCSTKISVPFVTLLTMIWLRSIQSTLCVSTAIQTLSVLC